MIEQVYCIIAESVYPETFHTQIIAHHLLSLFDVENLRWQSKYVYTIGGFALLSIYLLYFKKLVGWIHSINSRFNVFRLRPINLLSNESKGIARESLSQTSTHPTDNTHTSSADSHVFFDFLVNEMKHPLQKISLDLQNIPSDQTETIQKEVDALINQILAAQYLNQIDYYFLHQPTLINIEKATAHIFDEVILKLKHKGVAYEFTKQSQPVWASINVLYYKLFIKYLWIDAIKYLDIQDTVDIAYEITPQKVSIIITIASKNLTKNIDAIKRYSPYHKACKKMGHLLNLEYDLVSTADNLCLRMDFSLAMVPPNDVKPKLLHTNTHDKILNIEPSKPTLLIWANELNAYIINQLLPKDAFNVIIAANNNLLKPVIKSYPINMLIIYNQPLDQEIEKLITKIYKKQSHTKILYVTEDLTYTTEQKAIKLGLKNIIHLPLQYAYLQNQINDILACNSIPDKLEDFDKHLNQILTNETDNAHHKLIQDAYAIIQTRLNESDFNVKALCAALDVSSIKCYRVFKDVLHTTPSDFILKLKLDKAETLLLDSSLNIAEIAYELGFSDPKYFGKVFKNFFGLSPTKYRNQKCVR